MKARETYGVAERLYVTQTSTHCDLRALEGADEGSREDSEDGGRREERAVRLNCDDGGSFIEIQPPRLT